MTDWRFFGFFEKMKNGKNWKIDFFWIFFTWLVANYPSCILSGLWGENSHVFFFFKNKSDFQKIAHFVQSWRKWMISSIENEALVELSRSLYHVFVCKTSLFTLLCCLNSFLTNIFLLNTLFQCRVKMTPPIDLVPSEKPLRRSRSKIPSQIFWRLVLFLLFRIFFLFSDQVFLDWGGFKI